jgi:[acyl-carrier-protein] S-malonyltransferase
MQGAADALSEALNGADIRDLAVPVVANVTADVEKTAEEVRKNLADQITGSVRWVESVEKMVAGGVEVFVELGSGNVLAGLIKRISRDVEVYSVGDKASLEAVLG